MPRTTDLDGASRAQADTQGTLGSVAVGGDTHRQICQPTADGAVAQPVAALGTESSARHRNRWFAALGTVVPTGQGGLAGTQSSIGPEPGRRNALAGLLRLGRQSGPYLVVMGVWRHRHGRVHLGSLPQPQRSGKTLPPERLRSSSGRSL